ncbi:MAG: hypothetical protein HC857_05335 [Synechococcales cyanobacterium RU_4_20]|nr:hypothetical protein [Synechococcales cyanobacterium RU_4_20]NJR70307.1 hypothetical protein [Synechococcales cyanobacterium CRU_2_2]
MILPQTEESLRSLREVAEEWARVAVCSSVTPQSKVISFSSKNRESVRNNSRYGTQLGQTEKKLAKIQAENQALQQSIQDGLDKEPRELQARLQVLETRNQQLIGTVPGLFHSQGSLKMLDFQADPLFLQG